MITDYDAFAEALWAIDKREDVVVTIWQGELCMNSASRPC